MTAALAMNQPLEIPRAGAGRLGLVRSTDVLAAALSASGGAIERLELFPAWASKTSCSVTLSPKSAPIVWRPCST